MLNKRYLISNKGTYRMKIKIANKSHIPGIIKVWEEYVDYHHQIDPFFVRSNNSNKRFIKYIEDQMLLSKSLLLVSMDKNEITGYSLAQIKMYPPLFQQTKYGYISDLAVKSEYMKNDIGDLLLAGMIKWFKSKKIERVELQVFSQNKMGNTFWKKYGFEEYKYVLKIDFCNELQLELPG